MSVSKTTAQVPLAVCLGYGAGMLGMGLCMTVPSLLLLFYLTNTLALPPAWAGLTVFLPKAIILISDPLVGHVSDRFSSPWGRRRPFMLLGGLLTGIALVVLFTTPVLGTVETFLVVTASYLIYSLCSSLFAVPYFAMPVEMSDDAHERTRIMGFRMAFGMGGVVIAGAAAPMLVQSFGGGRPGYSGMAMVIGGICTASMLIATFGTARARFTERVNDSPGVATQLALIASNRPFLILLGAYVLQLIAIGEVTALIPYYVTYRLHAEASTVGLLFVVVSIVAMAAMAPWVWFSRRFGKVVGYRSGVAIYALSQLLFALTPVSIQANVPVVLGLMAAMNGVGLAGINLFSASLLPDAIQYDERITGLRRGAAYAGVWSAFEKTSLATGAMVGGFVLASFGFVSSLDPAQAQPATIDRAVLIGFVLIPMAIMVMSLAPLGRPALAHLSEAASEPIVPDTAAPDPAT